MTLETREEAMHNISVDIIKRYGSQFGFVLILVDIENQTKGHTSNLERESQIFACEGCIEQLKNHDPDEITHVACQPS